MREDLEEDVHTMILRGIRERLEKDQLADKKKLAKTVSGKGARGGVSLAAQVEYLHTALTSAETDLEKTLAAGQGLIDRTRHLQSQLKKKDQKIEELEKQRRVEKASKQEVSDRLEAVQRRYASAVSTINQRERDLSLAGDELEDVHALRKALQEYEEEAKAEEELLNDLRKQREELREELIDVRESAEKESRELHATLEYIQNQLQSLRAHVKLVERENDSLKEEGSMMKETMEALQKESDDQERTLRRMRHGLENKKAELEEKEKEVRQLQLHLSEVKKELETKKEEATRVAEMQSLGTAGIRLGGRSRTRDDDEDDDEDEYEDKEEKEVERKDTISESSISTEYEAVIKEKEKDIVELNQKIAKLEEELHNATIGMTEMEEDQRKQHEDVSLLVQEKEEEIAQLRETIESMELRLAVMEDSEAKLEVLQAENSELSGRLEYTDHVVSELKKDLMENEEHLRDDEKEMESVQRQCTELKNRVLLEESVLQQLRVMDVSQDDPWKFLAESILQDLQRMRVYGSRHERRISAPASIHSSDGVSPSPDGNIQGGGARTGASGSDRGDEGDVRKTRRKRSDGVEFTDNDPLAQSGHGEAGERERLLGASAHDIERERKLLTMLRRELERREKDLEDRERAFLDSQKKKKKGCTIL